jgi:hypothetical protein
VSHLAGLQTRQDFLHLVCGDNTTSSVYMTVPQSLEASSWRPPPAMVETCVFPSCFPCNTHLRRHIAAERRRLLLGCCFAATWLVAAASGGSLQALEFEQLLAPGPARLLPSGQLFVKGLVRTAPLAFSGQLIVAGVGGGLPGPLGDGAGPPYTALDLSAAGGGQPACDMTHGKPTPALSHLAGRGCTCTKGGI